MKGNHMTQQIQELIEKIKSEGITAAEEKAKELESKAQEKVNQIIQQAQTQADQIINKAQEQAKKIKETTQLTLKQASRDMLLSLREDIKACLNSIVTPKVQETLTTEHLANILSSLIKNFLSSTKNESNDIRVYLNPDDLKMLKEGFVKKLQDQLKQPLKFESATEIRKGFAISFDGGKSTFDFSDQSLVEYLSAFLNTEVESLLKESIQK